jgi:uncharacterized DUF497 family protein
LRFEWDERKDAENRRKHGVSFEEAETVFYDERALLAHDDDSDAHGEDRFVLLGLSAGLRTLLVCHAYRASDSVIRIISARKANRSEARTVREAVEAMKKNYDFAKARRNPYAARLKKQITIRLDGDTLAYFRALSDETEIPYQTLINFFLRDCAKAKKRPSLRWKASA